MFHLPGKFFIGLILPLGVVFANFTDTTNTTDHDSVTYGPVENSTEPLDNITITDILIDTNEVQPAKIDDILDENEVVPVSSVVMDLTLCNTTTGYLRGQTVTAANGKEVFQYLGIPFAEPPVGDLRFRKPVAKNRWEGASCVS